MSYRSVVRLEREVTKTPCRGETHGLSWICVSWIFLLARAPYGEHVRPDERLPACSLHMFSTTGGDGLVLWPIPLR